MRFCLILITALFLAGCSHHKAPPPNARLSDSITVIAGLNDQLQSWHGTPYRYGGMTRRGVDCSGFVVVTMRDRFDLQLPRETKQQASIGLCRLAMAAAGKADGGLTAIIGSTCVGVDQNAPATFSF